MMMIRVCCGRRWCKKNEEKMETRCVDIDDEENKLDVEDRMMMTVIINNDDDDDDEGT